MNVDTPTPSEVFYSGAVARVGRLILWLTAPAALAAGLWLGWQAAIGAAIGALAGYESFVGLSRAVNGLAERITVTGSRESGKRIVARFVGRYLVVGVGAYVIFTVSRIALYGFITGLCLPVVAMMCEAGYELTVALRRGL
jgi:hypothetical protein